MITNAREKLRHAQVVHEVVAGGAAQRFDATIRSSWDRCLSTYALKPEQKRGPTILPAADLRRRREYASPMYDIAQVEMAALTRLLNAPIGATLIDRDGVILRYVGDSRFSETARQSGFVEGAVWSEAEQGTNGMGTCLATQQAVLIDQDAHFLFQNAALTCCGAPILDGRGGLIGALNISGQLRLSAEPTLALVRLAVQNIENRVFLERYRAHHILRFHPHREFVATAGEGLLAFNLQGQVAGANRSALDWLGAPDYASLCAQTLDGLFGLDLDRLESLARHPSLAKPLPQHGSGLLCYGIVQVPTPAARRGRGATTDDLKSTRDVLGRAERETLREVLERCNWNVSLAATTLDISRRTLHRKLQAHSLRRYTVL